MFDNRFLVYLTVAILALAGAFFGGDYYGSHALGGPTVAAWPFGSGAGPCAKFPPLPSNH
jgi:hypothetical protein